MSDRPEIIVRKEQMFYRILQIRGAPSWAPLHKMFRAAIKASGTPSPSYEKNIAMGPEHLARVIKTLGVKTYKWIALDKETRDFIKGQLTVQKAFHKDSLKAAFKTLRKNSGHKLRGYQKYGINWMAKLDCLLNADDTGLGKTMQVLGVILTIEHAKQSRIPVLIIGSNIAGATWMDEVSDWYGEKLIFIESRKDFRFPKAGEIIFCTWGKLPAVRDLRITPEINTCLVGDEIQAVKNPKAKRTKSWNAIKAMTLAKGGGRVIGLSATPLENNPGQFWNVLHGCGIADICFGHFALFKELFHGSDGLYGIEWAETAPDPLVKTLLAPRVLRRRKYDVRNDLPTVMPPRFIRVDIPKRDPAWAEMAVVEEYMQEHNLSVEDLVKLALLNDVDFLNLSRIRRICAIAKIKSLMEYVEEYEEEKLIIMCCHKEPILEVVQRPGWAGIYGGISTQRRNEIKQQFQRGDLLGVACTVRAANESITLTAASRMCFVDQDWNPGKNYQAMGRNNRFGQEADRLFYDFLVIRDSIDEQVARVLARKETWIEGTLD